jgi:hypothetical protein
MALRKVFATDVRAMTTSARSGLLHLLDYCMVRDNWASSTLEEPRPERGETIAPCQ